VRGGEAIAHHPSLDERHRAAAGADAKGMWLRHDRCVGILSGNREKATRPDRPTILKHAAFSLRALPDAATLAEENIGEAGFSWHA